jgi:hypothetical protein
VSVTKSRGTLTGVAVALLIGILVAGCGSARHGRQRKASSGQQTAVQAGAARQALADEAASVVRQYWRARNLAYGALQPGPLTGFEDQAAALLSRGDLDYRRANGIPAGSSTSDLRDLHTYLTRPDRFPRLLLATVTTAAGDLEPEVYLLLFTRPAPQTPWKLSWQARYADNTSLPAVRVDADGFAVPLTPTQQRSTLRTDTTKIRRRLRDYRQQAAAATTPPRSGYFADTKETYGAAKALQADIRRAELIGVRQRLEPHDPHLPGYAVATGDGALVMVTIGEETVREYRALPLQQDQYQIGHDRRIAPGSYRTIVLGAVATYAVVVPASSQRRAVVVASNSSVTTVTTKP